MDNTTTLNKLKAIESFMNDLDYFNSIFLGAFYEGTYLNLDYDFDKNKLVYQFNKKINDSFIIAVHYKRNHYESNKNKVIHIISEHIKYLETGFCSNYDDLYYYEYKYGKINNKVKN